MILRPNYAQDAPPTSLEVGGFMYPVRVDYRVWIEALHELEDWIDDARDIVQADHNARILEKVQMLVFGGILRDESPADVLSAVLEFARGYPGGPDLSEDAPGEAVFSLAHDLNAVVIAIRNQSGIDLSYRRKEPFHWWEFLLEMQTLCGEHYILRLMEARAYRGNDPELLRRRNQLQLPKKRQMDAGARMEEINALFYNA